MCFDDLEPHLARALTSLSLAGPLLSDDEGSSGSDAGREDGRYLAANSSDDDDNGATGPGRRSAGEGRAGRNVVGMLGLGSLESKYLSASLLAKIESGQDVVINGRRL